MDKLSRSARAIGRAHAPSAFGARSAVTKPVEVAVRIGKGIEHNYSLSLLESITLSM